MIRKIILVALALFATSSIAGIAGNEPTFDPADGSVELPEVFFLGQEPEPKFLVKMQHLNVQNFEVTNVTPITDETENNENNETDEVRVTYDPETGIVEIPLIFVRSTEDPEMADPYAVKMQQKEDPPFFEVVNVTKLTPTEIEMILQPATSKSRRHSFKSSTGRVISCEKKIYSSAGGLSRSARRYFWGGICPSGWHPL